MALAAASWAAFLFPPVRAYWFSRSGWTRPGISCPSNSFKLILFQQCLDCSSYKLWNLNRFYEIKEQKTLTWRGKEGGNVWCTAASRNLPSNLQAKFLIYLRKVPPSDGRRLKSDRWTSFIEWGGPWKRLIRGRLIHLCRQKVWRVAWGIVECGEVLRSEGVDVWTLYDSTIELPILISVCHAYIRVRSLSMRMPNITGDNQQWNRKGNHARVLGHVLRPETIVLKSNSFLTYVPSLLESCLHSQRGLTGACLPLPISLAAPNQHDTLSCEFPQTCWIVMCRTA